MMWQRVSGEHTATIFSWLPHTQGDDSRRCYVTLGSGLPGAVYTFLPLKVGKRVGGGGTAELKSRVEIN